MNVVKFLGLVLVVIAGAAFADDAEVVSVKGKGVGVDETAALNDAYRDAVETAVGLYVDAEQMVKNDEIVEDKILTQSNAYIESYDVLKKSSANGVCTIKILAKVKTKALTKKLSTTMKTQTVEVGSELQNLYASEVTRKKSGEEGAALLKNTLDKLDPVHSLIDISLANAKPAILGADEKSGEQKLGYLFKSAISEDRYFAEFMPRIREALAQVTIGAPRQISLSVSGRQGLELEKCFNAGVRGGHALRSQCCGATIASPKLGEMRSNGSSPFSSQQRPCAILVTKANKLRTVYSCEVYELDKHAAETLTGWWRDRMPSDYDSLIARLCFVDEDDEELVQARVELGSCKWRMSCWLERFGNSIQNYMVIAPWFVQLGSFECYDWGKVSLPKEALPLVKKIRIDIVK